MTGLKTTSAVRALIASAALSASLLAAAPASAQDTAYAARKAGDTYIFDVALPPKFLAAITDPSKPCYNTTENSLLSGGRTNVIRTTEISWDANLPISKGRFVFSNNGGFAGHCWQSVDTSDAGWPAFQGKLEAMATGGNGRPSRVVLYHRASPAGEPALSVSDRDITTKLATAFKPAPLPDTLLPGESAAGLTARQAIVTTLNTVKPGTYFPDAPVLVPADLAAARQAMLRYGNIERANPQFRPNIPNARPVVKGQKFFLGDKPFDVVDQPDLTLNDRLNETAQWFAEALAAGQGTAHTFSGTFVVDGKPVAMGQFWDRAKHFNAGPVAGEVSGWGGAGSFPYNWMASNTHLAWWFGIDGPYKEIGLGAARDKDGRWHFVGVANK